MKVKDVIRMIERDGWRFDCQRGSHQQYVHPVKTGRVTVAGKPNDDMHPKTFNTVLWQARLGKWKDRK
jgi:predicted RNA binding protein YcfA (HicA-like mRNA interferase family)